MHKFLFYLLYLFPRKIRKRILAKITKFFINKYASIEVKGLENIPKKGQVIFVANHLSNADGLIMKFILQKIKKVVFVAGVKLKGEFLTRMVLELIPHIGIHPNKPDRKALREAINTVKKGYSLFIFPEGTRSRTGKLIKGRSGVVLIARNSNVPIVPIGLWGTEKLLPINQKGKMSNEWFNKADVKIRVGEPFYLEEINDEEEPIDLIMLKIAELIPKEYRGFYLDFKK